MNKMAEDPLRDEMENTPESSHPDVDNILDGPSLPYQATEAEHMDIDPSPHADDPPSPAKGADDDVVVTGTGFTSPDNHIALSKHGAKEALSVMDKGKWKADLDRYAHLSTQDIHSGILNRLYTNRDYEAGLVNMMKERYEVNPVDLFISIPSFWSIYNINSSSPQGPVWQHLFKLGHRKIMILQLCLCSPQGPVYLFKMNRDFIE